MRETGDQQWLAHEIHCILKGYDQGRYTFDGQALSYVLDDVRMVMREYEARQNYRNVNTPQEIRDRENGEQE